MRRAKKFLNVHNICIYFAVESTFTNMDNPDKHFEDLHQIRELMERSARFISLSGLSGISAGIFALIGAYFTYDHFHLNSLSSADIYRASGENWGFIGTVASLVLFFSVAAGIFFTVRNAKKKDQKIWDRTSQYVLINLALPLAAGGVFCLILLAHAPELIAAAMLIFYGLSLLNASKFTLPDIRYLGLCEILLGLICGFYTGYGLLFWTIGFGVLHIIYGTVMYFRYER
jgi:hypothetical protein